MNIQSITVTLFNIRDNPRLPVVGPVIFYIFMPFIDAVIALDRLVCSFSCGASLVDQLIYWPSEALADAVENFVSIFVYFRNAIIAFSIPFLLAYWFDANETITRLAIWVPLLYFATNTLGFFWAWVAQAADKLINSHLANGKRSDESDRCLNDTKPELKRNQKFIL